MRRRTARAAIAGVIAGAAMIAASASAAQEADEEITTSSFFLVGVHVDAAESGKLSVGMDWDFIFAGDHNDIFSLSFPEEQEAAGGAQGVWRTPITGISGGSEDGMAAMSVERSDGSVSVQFEDPDADREAVRQYHLDYEIEGLVEPGAGADGGDLLSWTIFDGGRESSMDTVDISFAGPGEVLAAECWMGDRWAGEECGFAEFEGKDVFFRQRLLLPEEGLTVAVTYEPGTFDTGIQRAEVTRPSWSLIAGGALLVLAAGTAITAGGLSLRAKSRAASRLP